MIAPVPRNAPVLPNASPDAAATADGLELRIETPENVVLTYTLAGPATRAAAFLIDLGLRLLVMTGFGIASGVVLGLLGLSGLWVGLNLLLWFTVGWGYYVLFETFWRGRSPGKRALGLRVLQDQGYPVTFWASVGRNLARVVDGQGLYAVAIATMLLGGATRRSWAARLAGESSAPPPPVKLQRLGDLLGRTVVVAERRVVLPREPVILTKIEPLPRESVPGPPPPPRTLALIDAFLGRRGAVSIARGHDLARPLARSLAARLRFAGEADLVEKYPMAFLARVYLTFLPRDEEEDVRDDRSRGTAIPRRPARDLVPLEFP